MLGSSLLHSHSSDMLQSCTQAAARCISSSGDLSNQVAVLLLQGSRTSAASLQDADSLAEAARIDAPGYVHDRICLRHLRKVYNTRPPKVGPSYVLLSCVRMSM